MKKEILLLTLIITLLVGTIFTGCESPAQKMEEAKEAQKVADTKVEKVKNLETWKIFKKASEVKIRH